MVQKPCVFGSNDLPRSSERREKKKKIVRVILSILSYIILVYLLDYGLVSPGDTSPPSRFVKEATTSSPFQASGAVGFFLTLSRSRVPPRYRINFTKDPPTQFFQAFLNRCKPLFSIVENKESNQRPINLSAHVQIFEATHVLEIT